MMTMHPSIEFVRVNPDAPIPAKAHSSDAAYDLCSMEDVTLYPGEWQMVGSGLSCAIPEGFVGLVVPRSGMGCKGLVLKNQIGVIDAGYRGEIGLTLFNNNPTHVIVKKDTAYGYVNQLVTNDSGLIVVHKGDRVAQLIILPVAQASLVEVTVLPDSIRGAGGFGSSGVGERL